MRKAFGILPVLLVSMFASAADANPLFVYTYTLSADGYSLTWTTNPMPVVTGFTQISAADLASYSVTGSAWAAYTLSDVILDITGSTCIGGCVGGVQGTAFTQPPDIFISSIYDANEGITPADYGTPGTYVNSGPILIEDYTCCGVFFIPGTDTLTVADTPEPSSLGTFLVGLMGIAALSRKCTTGASGAPPSFRG
jgi:PEP-CTERM motif